MKLNLDALASLVSGEILRKGRVDYFTGIASLDEAVEDQISFLGHEKYFSDFLNTNAGVVIVPKDLHKLPPEGIALLEVEQPSQAFGLLIQKLSAEQRVFTPHIAPTATIAASAEFSRDDVHIAAGAVIGERVRIGKGSTIGPNCVIAHDAIIGESVYLHPNVVVREACQIGDRCILQPGCVIGSDGFGYEFIDGTHRKVEQVGLVIIGDDSEIGANATIDRARFGRTLIGRGCKIDNLVQIGHNVHIGDHSIIVAQTGIAGSTHLGKYCTIAAQVGISGHLRIADQVTVAAGSGIVGNLDIENSPYWGFPARPLNKAKRIVAASQKLPDLLKRVAALEKRLEEQTK